MASAFPRAQNTLSGIALNTASLQEVAEASGVFLSQKEKAREAFPQSFQEYFFSTC